MLILGWFYIFQLLLWCFFDFWIIWKITKLINKLIVCFDSVFQNDEIIQNVIFVLFFLFQKNETKNRSICCFGNNSNNHTNNILYEQISKIILFVSKIMQLSKVLQTFVIFSLSRNQNKKRSICCFLDNANNHLNNILYKEWKTCYWPV